MAQTRHRNYVFNQSVNCQSTNTSLWTVILIGVWPIFCCDFGLWYFPRTEIFFHMILKSQQCTSLIAISANLRKQCLFFSQYSSGLVSMSITFRFKYCLNAKSTLRFNYLIWFLWFSECDGNSKCHNSYFC